MKKLVLFSLLSVALLACTHEYMGQQDVVRTNLPDTRVYVQGHLVGEPATKSGLTWPYVSPDGWETARFSIRADRTVPDYMDHSSALYYGRKPGVDGNNRGKVYTNFPYGHYNDRDLDYEKVDKKTGNNIGLFRYVFDKENLHVVLSGMNAMEQVKENIAITERCGVGCLSASEKACIDDIRSFLDTVDTIPCTACRYCVAGCPQQIQIPRAFSCYNTAVKFGNKEAQMRNYNRSCANLADCVECGQCREACPQHLDIPELLKKVRTYFD